MTAKGQIVDIATGVFLRQQSAGCFDWMTYFDRRMKRRRVSRLSQRRGKAA
jgi:hypothetical protein